MTKVKKSRPSQWQRAAFAAARWVVRLSPRALAGAGALVLAGFVVGGLNSRPAAQPPNGPGGLQAGRPRPERRLPAPAKAPSPTGRIYLNFERLDFNLPPALQHPFSDGKGYGAYLPASIRSYDGREIRIRGYMLPTKLEQGQVRECLVLANQLSCCFGLEPRFCQFIAAHIDGPAAPDLMDQPLRFDGKLHVGDSYDHGVWVALYSMNCTAVTP